MGKPQDAVKRNIYECLRRGAEPLLSFGEGECRTAMTWPVGAWGPLAGLLVIQYEW